jgi:hypothetical protein
MGIYKIAQGDSYKKKQDILLLINDFLDSYKRFGAQITQTFLRRSNTRPSLPNSFLGVIFLF